MGRWAQARKRGTVKAQVSEFPLSPPVPAVDFEGNSASDTMQICQLGGCPEPADGIMVQVATDPAGPWFGWFDSDCNDCGAAGGCVEGLRYYFRCAWKQVGVQISDWSSPPYPVDCEL